MRGSIPPMPILLSRILDVWQMSSHNHHRRLPDILWHMSRHSQRRLPDITQISVGIFSESLRSEKCSSHIVAGQNIGLKHCQKSYIDVKIDYHQSGAFDPRFDLWGDPWVTSGENSMTSARPLGDPWEKTWIWSRNIENGSKANI